MKKIVLALAMAAGIVGVAAPALAQPVVVVGPHHYYHHYYRRPVVVVRPYHRAHWQTICTWHHHHRFCERVLVR